MSKYEELAKTASKQTLETFKLKDECRQFADQIAFGYQAYIGVPEEHFSIVEVDRDLGASYPEGLNRNYTINLTRRHDGFWWFGFWIHYQDPSSNAYLDQIQKIGLNKSGEKFIIRMENDSLIDPSCEQELIDLFESMYKSTMEELIRPVSEPKSKIGFY